MILRFEPAKMPCVEADSQLSLIKSFEACRQQTLTLISNLQPKLIKQQAHPDFSPVGWHLGHIAYTESLWVLEKLAGGLVGFLITDGCFQQIDCPRRNGRICLGLEEILASLRWLRKESD